MSEKCQEQTSARPFDHLVGVVARIQRRDHMNHAIEYSSGLDPQRSTYLGRNGMHHS